jgi:hypothetical protein
MFVERHSTLLYLYVLYIIKILSSQTVSFTYIQIWNTKISIKWWFVNVQMKKKPLIIHRCKIFQSKCRFDQVSIEFGPKWIDAEVTWIHFDFGLNPRNASKCKILHLMFENYGACSIWIIFCSNKIMWKPCTYYKTSVVPKHI